MRKLAIVLALFAATSSFAQPDILRQTAVLRVPGMDYLDVKKDVKYDSERTLDLYRPAKTSAALPVVIFVNGVGVPALKEWGQYTSWPRLAAAKGLAAITYQTNGNEAAAHQQTEALLRYVSEHAGELKIDPTRIALWACSANVRIGTAILAAHPADDFRAAVFYYGAMETAPKHDAVPVLVTRAGLDILALNESIDRWVTQAVQLDAPVTLITYPQGRHGFDIVDDTHESKRIIGDTLDFLQFHLTMPREPRKEPATPAQLQRLLREKGADDFIARVREIRKSHPNAIATQEQILNSFGYFLLAEKKVADAVTVFELIAELEPNSPNAHDSLGDAYEVAGRKEDAIRESERALALLDNAPPPRRESIRASAEAKLKRLR